MTSHRDDDDDVEARLAEYRLALDRESILAELAELRAYKERTEAALQAWCDDLTAFLEEDKDGCEHLNLFTRSEIEDLKEAGLWRDPPQAEVQP